MTSKLEHPRLIICEGGSDAAFFRALTASRPAIPPFDIMAAPPGKGGSGRPPPGIDGFGKVLDAITSFMNFDQLERIVIVADSDKNAGKNFKKICDQIQATAPFGTPPTNRYVAPTDPLQWSTGGRPHITVMFIPWVDKLGHLECLLLPAAMAGSSPAKGCIDDFCKCASTNTWSEVHLLAEMKLRCLMAAGHKADPFISVRNVWDNVPDLIPVSHASFNQIADFLSAVP